MKCGSNVKFIKNSGEEQVFPSPQEGISQVAVHIVNHVFAIADHVINPKISILTYPGYEKIATLEGMAKIILL